MNLKLKSIYYDANNTQHQLSLSLNLVVVTIVLTILQYVRYSKKIVFNFFLLIIIIHTFTFFISFIHTYGSNFFQNHITLRLGREK